MTRRAVAEAQANIALLKYWGKREGVHAPATPSISIGVAALTTTTSVERTPDRSDRFQLNGQPASPADTRRIVEYLELWRALGLLEGGFHIESSNSFPTAAGLASSASGFAALAMALSAFSPRPLRTAELSRLARRGSGSAARSIPGGLAALPSTPDPAALALAPAERLPFGALICLVRPAAAIAPQAEGVVCSAEDLLQLKSEELAALGGKPVGSTEAMELSRTSPFYSAWLRQAKADYIQMLGELGIRLPVSIYGFARRFDLAAIGDLIEANCLAMHAVISSARPGFSYWQPGTLQLMSAVRIWREHGQQVYFTIDAGPHVLLVCNAADLPQLAQQAASVPGVAYVISSRPGGAARIIEQQ